MCAVTRPAGCYWASSEFRYPAGTGLYGFTRRVLAQWGRSAEIVQQHEIAFSAIDDVNERPPAIAGYGQAARSLHIGHSEGEHSHPKGPLIGEAKQMNGVDLPFVAQKINTPIGDGPIEGCNIRQDNRRVPATAGARITRAATAVNGQRSR